MQTKLITQRKRFTNDILLMSQVSQPSKKHTEYGKISDKNRWKKTTKKKERQRGPPVERRTLVIMMDNVKAAREENDVTAIILQTG